MVIWFGKINRDIFLNHEVRNMETELFGICPYTTTQVLIQGKWAVLMLYHIAQGPIRFNELQRRLPHMTNATLSTQLKKFEQYGLIERKSYNEMPLRVEYSLSEIGKAFLSVLKSIEQFGYTYIDFLTRINRKSIYKDE